MKAAGLCLERFGAFCLHELIDATQTVMFMAGWKYDGSIKPEHEHKYKSAAEKVVRTRFGDLKRRGLFELHGEAQ